MYCADNGRPNRSGASPRGHPGWMATFTDDEALEQLDRQSASAPAHPASGSMRRRLLHSVSTSPEFARDAARSR